jgi:2-hydroxy-3-keto-5-methylthiopentenyl-1-phosphate phosphatase
VFYIGNDSILDIHAARLADFTFAVKGSRLAVSCRREEILHKEIGDFKTVIEEIDKNLPSSSSW